MAKHKLKSNEKKTIVYQYNAYILRMWAESHAGSLVWRFSLENTRTQQRYGFANVDALTLFLENLNREAISES